MAVAKAWPVGLTSFVMGDSRFDRLTEDQKACLRLALLGHTSKQIAPMLGVSPHTVDARMRAALRLIGVDSRSEAARALAAHEGPQAYQPLTYQPSHLPPVDVPVSPSAPDQQPPPTGIGLPFPRKDRQYNDLAWWQITVWIIVIALGAILLLSTAGGLLSELNTLLSGRVSG